MCKHFREGCFLRAALFNTSLQLLFSLVAQSLLEKYWLRFEVKRETYVNHIRATDKLLFKWQNGEFCLYLPQTDMCGICCYTQEMLRSSDEAVASCLAMGAFPPHWWWIIRFSLLEILLLNNWSSGIVEDHFCSSKDDRWHRSCQQKSLRSAETCIFHFSCPWGYEDGQKCKLIANYKTNWRVESGMLL